MHIGVNNLPKVVTQRCLEQDLNPRPTGHKPKCLTRYTTAPPWIDCHPHNVVLLIWGVETATICKLIWCGLTLNINVPGDILIFLKVDTSEWCDISHNVTTVSLLNALLLSVLVKTKQTRMWANAQPDGRPAEHRWRPLFNAAKFGWRPLLDAVQ